MQLLVFKDLISYLHYSEEVALPMSRLSTLSRNITVRFRLLLKGKTLLRGPPTFRSIVVHSPTTRIFLGYNLGVRLDNGT